MTTVSSIVVSVASIFVAIVAAFIAYLQLIGTRDKIKIDLYGRRMDIYSYAKEILAKMKLEREIKDSHFAKYLNISSQAKWILGQELIFFLNEDVTELIGNYQDLYRKYNFGNANNGIWREQPGYNEFKMKVYTCDKKLDELFSLYLMADSRILDNVISSVAATSAQLLQRVKMLVGYKYRGRY